MRASIALLDAIPDIELDLAGCDVPASHGLPPPVVITLARRPDRWQAAVARFRHHGFERIIKAPAVDGRLLNSLDLARVLDDPDVVDRPLEQYLQPTRPAVGCFLSHLAIWKRFLQSGASHVLIAEDDAIPTSAAVSRDAADLITRLPANADMLLLGYTIMDGLAERTTDPRLLRIYYYNGTFAYLLTRRGCLALLPRLLPIKTHIDNHISLELVAERGQLAGYGAEPRLFEHDFTVLSDVYVPVVDAARADRELGGIFERCRTQLLAAGASLLPRYEHPPADRDAPRGKP